MPTYEYQCKKCRKKFEKMQRFSEPPVKTCPACKGKVERLIGGGSGLIFKGTGFYITDYKRKNAGGPSSGSASGKSGDKSSSSPA